MVPKTVPGGYLSVRETFERLFDAKFPQWAALARAGKALGFGKPREPAAKLKLPEEAKLELPEDHYFRNEREITEFIAEQFSNGDLIIFLHFTDGRTEPVEPYELNVPFFVSRISDEDFGIAPNDGRTVCLLKSDVDRLAAQFTGRKRGRPSDHAWEAIQQVADKLLSENSTRKGLAEAVLERLSAAGWDTIPDISTLRRKLNEWNGRK
jgi:hypothetical protein